MGVLITYKSLAPRGWVLTDECDSLLFSCLQAVGLDESFDVDSAFFNGIWHRKPAPCDCSSTISRDMFLGLFIYCLHFRRLDILDSIWNYAWKHGFKMGQEHRNWYDNRTWFTPGMVSLLAQIRSHLRGSKSVWRFLPEPLDTTPGYRSHLTMLKAYLHLRMYGELNTSYRNALKQIMKHSRNNPLVYALLNYPNTARQLLVMYWPQERLPTTRDWSEEWRTQRHDADTGLKPAPGKKHTHTGGDLLFVEHVLKIQGS